MRILIFILCSILFCSSAFAAKHSDRARHKNPTTQSTQQLANVDVNTADSNALQEIKGVGAKTAAKIISYRNEHGPFKNTDDLAKVRGVSSKLVAKIKDQLTFG